MEVSVVELLFFSFSFSFDEGEGIQTAPMGMVPTYSQTPVVEDEQVKGC